MRATQMGYFLSRRQLFHNPIGEELPVIHRASATRLLSNEQVGEDTLSPGVEGSLLGL